MDRNIVRDLSEVVLSAAAAAKRIDCHQDDQCTLSLKGSSVKLELYRYEGKEGLNTDVFLTSTDGHYGESLRSESLAFGLNEALADFTNSEKCEEVFTVLTLLARVEVNLEAENLNLGNGFSSRYRNEEHLPEMILEPYEDECVLKIINDEDPESDREYRAELPLTKEHLMLVADKYLFR